MKSVSQRRGADKRCRKRSATNRPGGETSTVPMSVRVPVYAASIGLFGVYAWGYLSAGLEGLAWGLVGVTAMAELLKPKLGELAAEALDARDNAAMRIIGAAAVFCVGLGAAGGVVAMHVADAPRARYADAENALSLASGAVVAAQALVDAVPTCAPDMPASRCERMIAENEPVRAERRARLDAAKQREAEARNALSATPRPGPGLPAVELWQKALFVAGAEFVMVGVPFAAMRLRRRQGLKPEKLPERNESTQAPAGKLNDGGWESRRAKYGPTGRKPQSRSDVSESLTPGAAALTAKASNADLRNAH